MYTSYYQRLRLLNLSPRDKAQKHTEALESNSFEQVQAVLKGLGDEAKEIMHRSLGGSPWEQAIKSYSPEIVDLFVQHGADVNQPTSNHHAALPPLFYALVLGKPDGVNRPVADYLMAKGADLDQVKPTIFRMYDEPGPRPKLTAFLLDYGVKPTIKMWRNVCENKYLAREKGDDAYYVKMCVEQGAYINGFDEWFKYYVTPLNALLSSGNFKGAQYLLEKGARYSS